MSSLVSHTTGCAVDDHDTGTPGFIMCSPTNFQAHHLFNPWMNWREEVDPDRALSEWESLRQTIEAAGGHVVTLSSSTGAGAMTCTGAAVWFTGQNTHSSCATTDQEVPWSLLFSPNGTTGVCTQPSRCLRPTDWTAATSFDASMEPISSASSPDPTVDPSATWLDCSP